MALLLSSAILAGCTGPLGEQHSEDRYLRIESARPEYASGDNVSLSILFVNDGDFAFERTQGVGLTWIVQPSVEGDVTNQISNHLVMNMTVVEPGEVALVHNLTLWTIRSTGDPWPPGTYKIRVTLQPDTSVFGEKIIRLT